MKTEVQEVRFHRTYRLVLTGDTLALVDEFPDLPDGGAGPYAGGVFIDLFGGKQEVRYVSADGKDERVPVPLEVYGNQYGYTASPEIELKIPGGKKRVKFNLPLKIRRSTKSEIKARDLIDKIRDHGGVYIPNTEGEAPVEPTHPLEDPASLHVKAMHLGDDAGDLERSGDGSGGTGR